MARKKADDSEEDIINDALVSIASCMPYPYPYKGKVKLHLTATELKSINKILTEELESRENSIEMYSDLSEWSIPLFTAQDKKRFDVEARALKRISELFTTQELSICADDFRFLILIIGSRIIRHVSVPSSIKKIFADGVKSYFNLEDSSDAEIKEWISKGLIYLAR